MAASHRLTAFLVLALVPAALAATFDTAVVNVQEYNITSQWVGGLCAAMEARNPGNNPTSGWTGQFAVSGAEGTLPMTPHDSLA